MCFRSCLEYPNELRELYYFYPLASHKIEIEKEMLSNYWLRNDEFYNIPMDNIKKLVWNIFDKEKIVFYYENV